jgi:hypothetical protein
MRVGALLIGAAKEAAAIHGKKDAAAHDHSGAAAPRRTS